MVGSFLFACLCQLQANSVSPKHRVVIELNVPGRLAYQTVLGNAENLKKAFKPEGVSIEIVCEGSGVDMVLAGGALATRISRDERGGIKFAACGNTIRARKLSPKNLLPFVTVVDAGVAEVVRRQEEGWSYLKGAY